MKANHNYKLVGEDFSDVVINISKIQNESKSQRLRYQGKQ